MQSRLCDENETTILMRRPAIITTSKAVIDFDSNDQTKMFELCLLPFTGLKTATTVTAKPVSHFRHKTSWQDDHTAQIFEKVGVKIHYIFLSIKVLRQNFG